MPALRSLALVVHRSKPGALEVAERLIELAKKKHVLTKMTTEYPIPGDFLKGQEACAVIGGDGTILGTVSEAVTHQVPIFGINQGRLGFLAGFTADRILKQLDRILEGRFILDHRPVLKVILPGGKNHFALNDVIIKSSSSSRMITLSVHAEGEWITDYAGDGLIFSTPTGSTAYSLSAGGPILHPSLNLVAMTPICPHTWSNRSVIFPPHMKLKIQEKDTLKTATLSIDGQVLELSPAECSSLVICMAEDTFPLLQPEDNSFFKTLRTKLKWGA